MSRANHFSFRSLFSKNYMDTLMGTWFNKSEINILWELGRNGPRSLYKLAKPLQQAEILFAQKKRDSPATKIEESFNYYRDFIIKIVRNLQDKGMVKTWTDSKSKRHPTMIELTFHGLVLYLRESRDKGRFIQAVENYSKYLPFSRNWEILNKKLGQGFVYNTLEQTVKNFSNIRQAVFKFRPIGLEFQGFIEDTFTSGDLVKVLKRKNEKAARFLKTREASTLRSSYIAYLAVHDLMILRKQNRKDIEGLLPNLHSEKELAYFGGRQVSTNSLFDGDRLKEFFPKYADIEFFLTGMFVEKLLWHEITVKKKHENHDFEVDYLFENKTRVNL